MSNWQQPRARLSACPTGRRLPDHSSSSSTLARTARRPAPRPRRGALELRASRMAFPPLFSFAFSLPPRPRPRPLPFPAFLGARSSSSSSSSASCALRLPLAAGFSAGAVSSTSAMGTAASSTGAPSFASRQVPAPLARPLIACSMASMAAAAEALRPPLAGAAAASPPAAGASASAGWRPASAAPLPPFGFLALSTICIRHSRTTGKKEIAVLMPFRTTMTSCSRTMHRSV
mmetsp:Transcript_45231/g.98867  ORF Transcript_45231/g.98867 Transcript_45231/m.98867 type:complete len:232 (-) Transcript_45231:4121-4816(-)